MFLGRLHIAEGKVSQLRRRIFDAFDFEAEVGQGIGDLINRRRGVEMVLEPGEGEFHNRSLILVSFGQIGHVAHPIKFDFADHPQARLGGKEDRTN